MHLTFVTPAWRRPAVTRLALAQRSILCDELAARGITASCVVIADDENLDVAAEFGFPTIEMDNRYLGRRLNAGFEYAQDSDYTAFIGSDDWMHIDLFDDLDGERIYAGHEITVVDLPTARMRHLGWRHRHGVPPWLIPRSVLEDSRFRPCRDESTRGMEWQIAFGIQAHKREWVMRDTHPLARVDFKSEVGMTSYDDISRAIGKGEEIHGLAPLCELYPQELVEMAAAMY